MDWAESCSGLRDTTLGRLSPIQDDPVEVARFLSLIDFTPVLTILLEYYCEAWRSRHPPEAMLRLVAYRMVKGFAYLTDLWRDLKARPEVALRLGFTRVPSYGAIWHFINERLRAEGFDRIRVAVLRLVEEACAKHGSAWDGRVSVDATPMEALRDDKEAAYNGYYRMLCYLVHKVVDCTSHLTLTWSVTPGDVDEGGLLTALILKTRSLGFKIREAFMDNGYASPQNYASLWLMKVKAWIGFRRKARRGWRGKLKTLRLRYRKMHRKGLLSTKAIRPLRFDPKPERISLNKLLLALFLTDQHEYVGAHLRNLSLKARRRPGGRWLKKYNGKRNMVEGSNGHHKTQLNLDRLSAKGLEKAKSHVSQVLLTEAIVAYGRVQHGTTSNLTRIAELI